MNQTADSLLFFVFYPVFLFYADDDDQRSTDPRQAQTEVLLGAEDNSAQRDDAPRGESLEEQLSDPVSI